MATENTYAAGSNSMLEDREDAGRTVLPLKRAFMNISFGGSIPAEKPNRQAAHDGSVSLAVARGAALAAQTLKPR